jgi:capsular polysaccharide transport system permease protein
MLSSSHGGGRRSGRRSGLRHGFEVQARVIGALILRELHTRYGRDNIGYLWMVIEPMLLAGSVALLHAGSGAHGGSDFRPMPFALTGYCVFIIFRSIVSRAESALEANKPLLYHTMVSIFDMLAARAALEALSTAATLAALFLVACAFDLASPPARPLLLLAGILLMTWFSFAISMLVCMGTHFSKAFAKFLHPALYILMPISGAFFLLSWIPEPFRAWLSWSPMNGIFEMVFTGVFESVDSPYYDGVYIAGWCLFLTFTGLLALRIVRRHVHLH